jgi:hypothetical protein
MTLEELDRAIVDCYRAFSMNRYAEMTLQERDEFKKKYMMIAMKLMKSNSFIEKKIGAIGEMPAGVRRIIESVEF